MDQQIGQVISKYTKLLKMIIQSKGKEGDKSARVIIPNTYKIMEIFYTNIPYNKTVIIKVKRAMKAIKINDGS